MWVLTKMVLRNDLRNFFIVWLLIPLVLSLVLKHIILYFFRSQDFLTTLKTDLDKLTAHVRQHYPDDEVLKNWATHYNQTGRATLD